MNSIWGKCTLGEGKKGWSERQDKLASQSSIFISFNFHFIAYFQIKVSALKLTWVSLINLLKA